MVVHNEILHYVGKRTYLSFNNERRLDEKIIMKEDEWR